MEIPCVSLKKNIPLVSASAKKLLGTPEGTIAAALVQDFLQCLGLDFSLAVFAPESGHSTSWTFPGTEALTSSLNLNTEKGGQKTPLLIELLRERESNISPVEKKNSQVKCSVNSNRGHYSQLPMLNGMPQPDPSHSGSELFKTKPESSLSNFLDKAGSENSKSFSTTEAEGRSGLSKNGDKDSTKEAELKPRPEIDRASIKLTSQDDKLSSESYQTSQNIGVGDNSNFGNAPSARFPVLSSMEEKNQGSYHTSPTGKEKQYEDDFSSMSDKEDQDEEEEEECVEEVDDIDEDISIDDLINSSASIGSDATKDQSLSQASDVVNYQEDL
ncbi:centrosomal protein 43-like [Homarus americanus]|uniref:centrosomal protein 43-like n=1 Tax=Homarus americanus TaxID=6706 RepID=UPI001C48C1BA|nr:centrosomal protein 43-like [Homarus americanus]